jgi:3-methylfumaryl-CoA hydratase
MVGICLMDLQSHVGREEICNDIADPVRMAGLAALLDHDSSPWQPGTFPPLGHWLCFPPIVRQSLIGTDGHPTKTDDGLLPNIDLPRRMWAGSRVAFLHDIEYGAALTRRSTLTAAQPKSGRSGTMLFVTVRHEIGCHGQVAIVEEQDIVYRDAPMAGAPSVRSGGVMDGTDHAVRIISPDPIQLFRYSALTFNSHRIHYDRDYACNIENYPGLVVHGPLIATLLMDHMLRECAGAAVRTFDFRALSPLFDGDPIRLGMTRDANTVQLRAIGPAGVAMTATATLSS